MLIESLKRQFDHAFGILQAAIGSFSPEAWRAGSPPFNGPARATAHVLQAAEFYTSGDRAVFVNLGKKVWELPDDALPTQEAMDRYLAEARAKTLAWIDSVGDAGLAAPFSGDPSMNVLERIAYALRHLQHHTGEICAYQKHSGLEPAPWK
jgi:uncharacterized damage-inducible protein DinB